jgi:hypothetical protein
MRIFEFDDGYYIVHAKEKSLIGNEVLAIGGTPADSVAAALAPWGIMSFAEPLRTIGVVEQTGEIPVRMRAPDGRTFTRDFGPKGAWSLSTFLYEKSLQEPVKGKWSPATGTAGGTSLGPGGPSGRRWRSARGWSPKKLSLTWRPEA